MLKPSEIRELGQEEVRKRIDEEEDQLRRLHFQHAIAQIENPALLRQKRRLLARLKTILREQQNEV